MQISRIKSGLLYYDNFNEQSLLWSLSPSNLSVAEFGDNGLILHKNEEYTSYTFREPEGNYTCLVEIDHVPTKDDDIAGVLIYDTPENYAEIQSLVYYRLSQLTNGKLSKTEVGTAIYSILKDKFVEYSINEQEFPAYDLSDYSIDLSSKRFLAIRNACIDILTSMLQSEQFVSYFNGEVENIDEIISYLQSKIEEDDFVDTEFYRYIKYNKINRMYYVYGSQNGIDWIFIGSTQFLMENNSIGFFIYGKDNDDENEEDKTINVKSITITDSNYFEIQGVQDQYDIQICNSNNEVMFDSSSPEYASILNRKDNKIIINSDIFLFPIRNASIKVSHKLGYLSGNQNNANTVLTVYEDIASLYPGDIYYISYDIKIFIEGREVTNNEIFDLGSISSRLEYFNVIIQNMSTDIDLTNLHVNIVRYSEYYGGYEEVEIALNNSGNTVNPASLDYSKEVLIESLLHSESANLYMKLKENTWQSPFNTSNDYRFKITIS